MATRPIKKATQEIETSYPSLKEHLANRRRFLALAGASVAAGGILAACTRGIGSPGLDPGADAQVNVEPDADVTILGDIEEPHYYLLRIPITGDISAYLADGGYCSFYIELATYAAATFDTLSQHMVEAETRCREVLQDFTYDGLNSAAGVASAEDDLIDGLDELVQGIEGHSVPTVEYVTLNISYLEPYSQLDGGIGMPEYP